MKSDHFQDSDIRVNERLTKALLLFVPLILAAFLPVGRHIVSIPENELYSLVPVCFFFLSSPFILGLFKPASSFLKYYIIIDISAMSLIFPPLLPKNPTVFPPISFAFRIALYIFSELPLVLIPKNTSSFITKAIEASGIEEGQTIGIVPIGSNIKGK